MLWIFPFYSAVFAIFALGAQFIFWLMHGSLCDYLEKTCAANLMKICNPEAVPYFPPEQFYELEKQDQCGKAMHMLKKNQSWFMISMGMTAIAAVASIIVFLMTLL